MKTKNVYVRKCLAKRWRFRARNISFVLASLFTMSAALTISTPVHAQEAGVLTAAPAPAPTPEVPGHILKGHRFLPSFYFPNPFALPTLSTGLGLGYGTFSRNVLGTDRDLKVGTTGPQFEAQIKLARRLVLIAGLRGNVVFGLNGESINLYGASARYQPRLGLLWEILRSESSVLSVALEWEKPRTLQSSPLDFSSGLISNLLGNSDDPRTNKIETTRWRPGVRYAHAFNPMIGIVAFGAVDFVSETFNSISSSNSGYTLGASLDTDFKPLWKIPIGLALSYRLSDRLSGDDPVTQLYTGGLFETFSERFNFGFEIGRLQRGDQRSTLGAFVTRYYY